MNKMTFSMRFIIFLSYMLIVFIYAVFGIGFFSIKSTQRLKDEAIEKNKLQCEHVITTFDGYYESIYNVYSNLIIDILNNEDTNVNLDIENKDADFLKHITEKAMIANYPMESIFLYDNTCGRCYGSVYGFMDNCNSEWVQLLNEDKAGLVRTYDENKKKDMLSLIGKFETSHLTTLYISVNLNIDIMKERILQPTFIDGSIQIFKRNDDILLSTGDITNVNIDAAQGSKIIIDGEEYIYISSSSNSGEYTYILAIPIKELYSSIYKNTRTMIYIMIGLIVTAFILTYMLAGYVSKPIVSLADYIKSYKSDIKINQPKIKLLNDKKVSVLEHAILYDNFNTMTDRIERLIDDINESNDLRENEEIKNIRAAVNPHFQSNIINSIICMIEDDNNDEAVKALMGLSGYIRNSLTISNNFVFIKDELENIKDYFTILNMTTANTISLKLECSQYLYKSKIPSLILQPIIENAVIHGLKGKNNNKELEIIFKIENDDLIILIKDNGRGINEKNLKFLQTSIDCIEKQGYSFGLWNINRRCQLLFGNKYRITINSKIDIGTTVTLRVPYSREV